MIMKGRINFDSVLVGAVSVMNLELEVMDSQTQVVLASVVDKIKSGKKSKASESWAKEHTVMAYWATRFNCRLENSGKPKSEWKDCEKTLP
jgi:hypothetical protein